MGAGQSSSRDETEQGVKTSYYELLGVQRQATEDEIKKGYRRKALELHPDRNYGNEEHATKIFAEVQAAYEVLSDPQERAWYDSHESAILRGEDGEGEDGVPSYDNVKITTADDLARMVRKFNSNVEFTDSPSGFFGYLRETFEQLAKEEEIAAAWDEVEPSEYPSFGHKDDNYDDVVRQFYAAWSSFATVKNFAWKDKYRLSEAPDRWYRRRMEQENKKYRQDGIREFNDAVRSLVAFVRKRDPRYVPSTQTEAERQKTLRDAAAAQAARARAANEAKLNAEVPEWTKSREPDPLAEMEGTFEEESEEEEVLECVACNKIFKSERQWEAHEKSKKHQKAMFALQKKMQKDNANLDLSGRESGNATPEVDLEDDPDRIDEDIEDAESVDDDAEPRANGLVTPQEDSEEVASGSEHEVETKDDADASKAEAQDGKTHDVEAQVHEVEISDDEDSDYASPETIQARLQGATLSDPVDEPTETLPKVELGAEDNEQSRGPAKKMGKAAQKRAKKAAAAATGSGVEAAHGCAGCDKAFPTKSRLFQHLKDHPEHVAYKSDGATAGGGKKKGRGKR